MYQTGGSQTNGVHQDQRDGAKEDSAEDGAKKDAARDARPAVFSSATLTSLEAVARFSRFPTSLSDALIV